MPQQELLETTSFTTATERTAGSRDRLYDVWVTLQSQCSLVFLPDSQKHRFTTAISKCFLFTTPVLDFNQVSKSLKKKSVHLANDVCDKVFKLLKGSLG